MARAILRLIHKIVDKAGVEKVEPGLASLLGSTVYEVEAYSIRLDSLILQSPHTTDVYRYRGPIKVAPAPWRSYCKWHDGPLDSRDKPWERIYCNMEAEGYCRYHRKSLRSLYDICLSTRGPHALEACRRVDEEVKTEYSLYLTSPEGRSVKVGVTRSFRILDRIAEQPHSLATVLATYPSLYEARRAELSLSRAGIASESSPRRLRRIDPRAAAPLLSSIAEKASRLLGVGWDGRLFRVKPPSGLNNAPITSAERLLGVVLEPRGYWGGLLLLEGNGSLYLVKSRSMMHMDSVIQVEGDSS